MSAAPPADPNASPGPDPVPTSPRKPGRDLLARLAAGPVVADGAMGTLLYERGVYLNRCYDEVVLTAPELIEAIHRDYLRAGAEVLETNSFGANPIKLGRHGLAERTEEINRRAAEIARGVAGDGAVVLGAIGPLGIRMEPWGPTSLSEARAAYDRQAAGLVAGGVDGFCLETFGDPTEIHAAILAARAAGPGLPVVCQMTVDREGVGLYGTRPEDFAARLDAWGADVIGLNCSVGPSVMLGVLERLRAVTTRPLSVQPNAGPPREVDGRMMFLCTPDYLEKSARRFIEAGARLLGGCCGTTPDHIRALAKAVRRGRAVATSAAPAAARPAAPAAKAAVEPPPFATRSRLARALAEGRRPLLVELLPPKGCDPSPVIEKAKRLAALGAAAVNIPDGARASAKMSPIALAARMQAEAGVEAVLHVCCRDRNILGLQADLLGAAGLGVKNLILITGDPPILGDYPDATAVFDLDAIGLVNVAARLNRGQDLAENPTGPSAGFVLGVGLNPTATNLKREVERWRWKVDAGAEYAVTQPVFDVDALFRFLDALGDVRIPVLAGMWPLQSVRNADFLSTEVPGVTVPDAVRARLAAVSDAEGQRRVGADIAAEMAEAAKDRVQGYALSLPFGRVDAAERFTAALASFLPAHHGPGALAPLPRGAAAGPRG
jgi:methionine synthase I (cobalamin-dependent)/5,10-methylenetetrahydrofolate reductase